MSRNLYAVMALSVVVVLLFSYIVFDTDNENDDYNTGDYATYSSTSKMDTNQNYLAIGPFFTEGEDPTLSFVEKGEAKYELISKEKNNLEFLKSYIYTGKFILKDPLDLDLFLDPSGYVFTQTYLTDESRLTWMKTYDVGEYHIREMIYSDSSETLIDSNITHAEVNAFSKSGENTSTYNYEYEIKNNEVVSITYSNQGTLTMYESEHIFIFDTSVYESQEISESLGYPVLVNRTVEILDDGTTLILDNEPTTGVNFSYLSECEGYKSEEYLIDTNIEVPAAQDGSDFAIYSFNHATTQDPDNLIYRLAFGKDLGTTVNSISSGTISLRIQNTDEMESATMYTTKVRIEADTTMDLTSPIAITSLISLDGFVNINDLSEGFGNKSIWTKTITDSFGTICNMMICSDSADKPDGSRIYWISSTFSNESSDSKYVFTYNISGDKIVSVDCNMKITQMETDDEHPFIVDKPGLPYGYVFQNCSYPVFGFKDDVVDADAKHTKSISWERTSGVTLILSITDEGSDFNMILKHTNVYMEPYATGQSYVYSVQEGENVELQKYVVTDSTTKGFTMISYLKDENGDFTILNTKFGGDGSVETKVPYVPIFAFSDDGDVIGGIIGRETLIVNDRETPFYVWEFISTNGNTYILYENNSSVYKYEFYQPGAEEPYLTGTYVSRY